MSTGIVHADWREDPDSLVLDEPLDIEARRFDHHSGHRFDEYYIKAGTAGKCFTFRIGPDGSADVRARSGYEAVIEDGMLLGAKKSHE